MPTSTYGSTKIAIEYFLNDISKLDVIDIISLRYFNPTGSHGDRVIYENINNDPQNLMPRVVRVAMGKDNVIKIFGNDYKTADGTAQRDYIHIEDLVNGHMKAIERIKFMKGYETFNLGTGSPVSVLELIVAFEKANKLKINYEYYPRRPGDVEVCYADVSKAKDFLEWKTEKNIEEMCFDALSPFKY